MDVSKIKDLELNEFLTFCDSFLKVGFKPSNDKVTAKLKNIEIEMKNEGADLSVYINNNKVTDLANINYGGIFVLETTDSRAFISSILENLSFIKSLDFIKRIVAENKSCYVINLGKDMFVIENLGGSMKMSGANLQKYLIENYNYDISTLVEAELTVRDQAVLAIENKKKIVTENITKLESSINTLDESLNKNLNEDDSEKVKDLKFTIQKKINSLKEDYITLEQEKKKLFETELLSNAKSYSIHEEVKLKDGRFGKIHSVDSAASTYMVKTEDGKIHPVRGSDIN